MRVLVAYFSATGNTARMAEVMQRELAGLGAEAELLDITSYAWIIWTGTACLARRTIRTADSAFIRRTIGAN
jgi:flavodoxin